MEKANPLWKRDFIHFNDSRISGIAGHGRLSVILAGGRLSDGWWCTDQVGMHVMARGGRVVTRPVSAFAKRDPPE